MRGTIRLRAVVLGVILGLLICAFTPYNNAYLAATPLAGGNFPLAPFFLLVWLTVGSALAGRLRKGPPPLSGLELFLIFGLSAAVSGIAWTGLARTFFINLTAVTQFATEGNRWAKVLAPLVPAGLSPSDPEAVQGLYNGLRKAGEMGWTELLGRVPWSAWAAPLAAWGVFILLSYLVLVCLTNLFSRQWITNERINFPLLRLPQTMAEAVDQQRLGGFFADRFLLLGLGLSAFLHLINGLHFYLPSVPEIPTLILAGPYFPKVGLFSGFHKLKIHIIPAFLGFAFLTARQVSFSFWFFFLAAGLFGGALSVMGLTIPASALGPTFGPTLTDPPEMQMVGAYLVFFLFIVWLARRHLLHTFRAAIGRETLPDAEAEWFSARTSLYGAVLGFALLVLWCLVFGMSLVTAMAALGVFFIFALVAAKVVCQGGIAYFTLTAAPLDGLLTFFGGSFFRGTDALLPAMAQKVLFVDLRESAGPGLLHAAKISEWIKNKRLILAGLLFALAGGVAVSFASMLAVSYKFGLRELSQEWATQTTLDMYETVQRIVETPADPSRWVGTFTLLGAGVMLALVVCYQRLPWWPLHPIGYLTAYSSAMRILWFSFFLGWLCNNLTLRYGGPNLFRRIRFLFFGLILGDFLMGGFWAVYGLLAGQSFQVLPG